MQHHERIDGSGYPNGLRGESICEEAKIIAVADVVEAMSSVRPYRPALGIDYSLRYIEDGSGTLFDSKIVKICIDLFLNKNYKFPKKTFETDKISGNHSL